VVGILKLFENLGTLDLLIVCKRCLLKISQHFTSKEHQEYAW